VRFWASKYKTKFGDDPSLFSAYGYMVMDYFIQGATKAGANLTTDSFIKAMDAASFPTDMFGAPPYSFTPTKRLGSDASRLSQIQDGKWKAISEYARPAN
jgi:branched-chain amino acid transport system substrate-binding protein